MRTHSFSNSHIYFPVRKFTDEQGQQVIGTEGNYTKLALNDIIEIRINSGQPNEDIEVIIRYA